MGGVSSQNELCMRTQALPFTLWAAILFVAIVLSSCASISSLFAKPVVPLSLTEMEVAVLQQINQIRQQQGIPTLQPNPTLAQVARNYSQQMVSQNFFSHTDPSGNEAVQRVYGAGIEFELVGENLYKSVAAPDPVKDAVEGWMESPGHRANVMRSVFTETGVGAWQAGDTYYFTQLFIQPRYHSQLWGIKLQN
jgi:uncharacterized protein YkwD